MLTVTCAKSMASMLWRSIFDDETRLDPIGRLAPSVPIQGVKAYRAYDKLISEFERLFPDGMPLDRVTGAWTFNRDDWENEHVEFFLSEESLVLLKRFWDTFTRNSYRSNMKQKEWLEGIDAALENAAEYKPHAVGKVP